MSEMERQRRDGLIFGVSAYLLWGFLPLYFALLARVFPTEIVAQRITWSLVFLALLATFLRRWPAILTALTAGRILVTLTITALLIGVNWLVYIYAIASGHVLESSLGYYLNPLVNILLGVALLKEKLSRLQVIATMIAAGGVAMLAAGAGAGLWVSLVLAVTFGLYGFVRKIAPVDALEGLTVETIVLLPIALGYIVWLQSQGQSGFLRDGFATDALLVAGGTVTAVPLLLFTAAARRLPYSTMGFLQYLAPSLQFLLAIFYFREALTPSHLACFAAIWTALALVTFDGLRGRAAAKT